MEIVETVESNETVETARTIATADDAVYTPKQATEKIGMSIHTLRYYEQLGLLDTVERANSGHRRYSDADLRRLEFLKRLKATGMPISGMVRYVEMFRQGEATLTERRQMLEQHRQQVEAQIALLYDTLNLLNRKIENYQRQEQEISIKGQTK